MASAAHILIVDDEPRMRTSLRTILESAGYSVDEAGGMKAALESAGRQPFDLALLDLSLRDGCGLEVVEPLAEMCPDAPVVVLTGFASTDSAITSLRKGVFDFLRKPAEPEDLLRTIERALEHRNLQKEKEQLRKELTVSQERYQFLVQSSPDIIYTLDAQGRFSFISDAARALLGREPASLLGRSYAQIISRQDRELARFLFNERRSVPRRPGGIELHLQPSTTAGEELSSLVVELRAKGLYDRPVSCPDKVFLGSYGAARDVTGQKRAEAQRQASDTQLQQTLQKLRRAMGATIRAITSTVEARDPYTAGHQQRVANLARAIGTEMGLGESDVDGLRMAGSLHDLGKINIPAEILSKPGHISEIEFNLIKTHSQIGYEILKDIEFAWPVAEIVYQHHEKMDGSGYPRGLKDGQIILPARIIAVSDVVEAVASHRPYRPALGVDCALQQITEKKGIHFDPQVVEACLRVFQEKGFSFDRN
jgi:PAS domain S-box-containing protein/putative nucleotidyltransferase with HDIG domain